MRASTSLGVEAGRYRGLESLCALLISMSWFVSSGSNVRKGIVGIVLDLLVGLVLGHYET